MMFAVDGDGSNRSARTEADVREFNRNILVILFNVPTVVVAAGEDINLAVILEGLAILAAPAVGYESRICTV
jgi:hypothetical protein